MEDEEYNQTLEYLMELAEALSKENEALRHQNEMLAEKVFLMEQAFEEETTPIENKFVWIVPKVGEA